MTTTSTTAASAEPTRVFEAYITDQDVTSYSNRHHSFVHTSASQQTSTAPLDITSAIAKIRAHVLTPESVAAPRTNVRHLSEALERAITSHEMEREAAALRGVVAADDVDADARELSQRLAKLEAVLGDLPGDAMQQAPDEDKPMGSKRVVPLYDDVYDIVTTLTMASQLHDNVFPRRVATLDKLCSETITAENAIAPTRAGDVQLQLVLSHLTKARVLLPSVVQGLARLESLHKAHVELRARCEALRVQREAVGGCLERRRRIAERLAVLDEASAEGLESVKSSVEGMRQRLRAL